MPGGFLPGPGPLFPSQHDHDVDAVVAGVDTPPQAIVVPLNDERRRQEPPQDAIAISGALASVTVPAVVFPPAPLNIDRLEQRVRYRALDPVVLSGDDAALPPDPVVVDRADQRDRYRALPPTILRGALAPQAPVQPPAPTVVPLDQLTDDYVEVLSSRGFAPAAPVGDVPPEPTVVDRADQRDRYRALPPIVISGASTFQLAPTAAPQLPIVVPLFDERGRRLPQLPSTAAHGFVDPGPGPVGTTPPPPTVVENDDRKRRTPPLQPVSFNGLVAGLTPPPVLPPQPTSIDRVDERDRYRALPPSSLSGALQAVPGAQPTPPAPFVVPLDERRRFLAQIPPGTLRGYDDVVPPGPNVVEPTSKRRPTPDPTILSGAQYGAQPPTVLPTGPFVVPLDERRRFLALLPPATATHGFVDPGPGPVGTTPPPPLNLDRVDQRRRYLPLDPIVFSPNGAAGAQSAAIIVTGSFQNNPAGTSTSNPSAPGFDEPAAIGGSVTNPDIGDFDPPTPVLR